MKVSCNILNPVFFLKYMKNIASFCDEGLLHFDNGIRFVGMDSSRIVVMELKLSDDIVTVDSKAKLVAPINLWSLAKIIARFSKPSYLSVIYDDPDNTLIIKGEVNGRKKTFKLNTIDIDMDFKDPIPTLSKIKYNAIFKVNGGEVLDAIKDAELWLESVNFKAKDMILTISADGINGSSKTEIDIEKTYGNEISDYSVHFLKKMLDPMKSSDIMMMLKSAYPLAMYDKLSAKSHMLYYLAPRIISEVEFDD